MKYSIAYKWEEYIIYIINYLSIKRNTPVNLV
nr:MAG TPA: hypothetical protein [Bacteriophage sp.]